MFFLSLVVVVFFSGVIAFDAPNVRIPRAHCKPYLCVFSLYFIVRFSRRSTWNILAKKAPSALAKEANVSRSP